MTAMPRRFTKMEPGAINVGPGTIWQNVFPTTARFRFWLNLALASDDTRPRVMADLARLRGHDLVCGCEEADCHADIWLEYANRPNP